MAYLWLNATNRWLGIRLVSALIGFHGISVAQGRQQVARHQTDEYWSFKFSGKMNNLVVKMRNSKL